MHCLAPGVYSRYTREELKNALKDLDLVVADLDECIFPGITKVILYRNICLLLIRSRQAKNCLLLGQLLTHALIVTLMKLVQMLCPGITNKQLILYFAKIIKPVSFSYLQKAAQSIPGRSYAGARETLEILSKKATVGIISQGLDIVLNEYVRQFNGSERSIIDFWDGNALSDLIDWENRADNGFIFNQHDKEVHTRRSILQFGAKKAMVIGHNRDDLGMIRVVREYDGIVVGFNPTSEVEKWCDIVVTGKDWMRLKQIVRELNPEY